MASIGQLEAKLDEALYQDNLEPKLVLLKKLADHHERDKIYQKTSLISAILRTLEEEHRKSQDLTRIILRFVIDLLDYHEQYGVMDANTVETMQRALNNVLKILRFEFSRFQKLAEKHKKIADKREKNPSDQLSEQLAKETRSINLIIGKQNQIFHMCLE